MSTEVFGPIAAQLGTGGIGGFLVGYSIKKVAKIVAVMLGLLFVGLQYLAYVGILQINYDKLIESAQGLTGRVGEFTLPSFLISNIPFAGSFAAGFAIGFAKG